jgi:hypothetical protein
MPSCENGCRVLCFDSSVGHDEDATVNLKTRIEEAAIRFV